MYKDYFRLSEMPFSIAPDPRFLFMSDRHREAIAHLLYGVQSEGGIVLLTGEVGTGKTTVCRSLLEQLPENIDVAFILNPRMSVEELLQTVCEEFHVAVAPEQAGIKRYVDAIHHFLIEANAQGRRAILIVDEAQNLDPMVLEQLRLLTNLETNTRKLLQIFLIGQPELQHMLAQPEMRQVAQRVVARYHLAQLDQSDLNAYVTHRLRISGAPPGIIPDKLMKPLHRASGGVPRLINLICDRSLLGTYVKGGQQVTLPILKQAVREVVAARKPVQNRWLIAAAVTIAGVAVMVGAAGVPHGVKGLPLPWQTAMPPAAAAKTPPPVAAAVVIASQAPAQVPAASAMQPTSLAPSLTPAPLGTLAWPQDAALADSEMMAFQSLFKLYGIDAAAFSGDPCRHAIALGMRCYSGKGGLSDLLLLDQPVVMRLSTADGHEYSVALTALDMARQLATVLVAGKSRNVAVTDLASLWSGRFVVIWKAPAGFGDSLVMNQRGPAVAWLRKTMTKVDGIQDDGSATLDDALARRIRAYQLTEGIQPDGLVGPVTAIRLNARSGQAGPRISSGVKS